MTTLTAGPLAPPSGNAAATVTHMRDNRRSWQTAKETAAAIGAVNDALVSSYLTALAAAGVLERRLRRGTGSYEYRWLGAGPGGVAVAQ